MSQIVPGSLAAAVSRSVCGEALGRPSLHIESEDLRQLYEVMGSWTRVLSTLGVSRQTLWRRRQEYDMPMGPESFSLLSDAELDEAIGDILDVAPQSGEVYVQGSLVAKGIRVQRQRVRNSLRRIDPVNRSLRRSQVIIRRNTALLAQMPYGSQ